MKEKNEMIMELCLLAGKLLLQNGAETYRVEDTMQWIASAYQPHGSQSYVTPTVIILSIEVNGGANTKILRVSDRSRDLHKLTRVNQLSREIASGMISLEDALIRMKKIAKEDRTFPIWMQIVAAAIASGCFLIMFQGGWGDFLAAAIAGAMGFTGLLFFRLVVPIKFLAEFMASITLGFAAVFFVRQGWGVDVDRIIISAVMPLVPGLLITSAVRDLMADHLISGIAKGAEAMLTAVAVGSGVAFILTIFS